MAFCRVLRYINSGLCKTNSEGERRDRCFMTMGNEQENSRGREEQGMRARKGKVGMLLVTVPLCSPGVLRLCHRDTCCALHSSMASS